MPKPTVDLAGSRHGDWIVQKRGDTPPGKRGVFWWCQCSCGTPGLISADNLRRGLSRGCGCSRRD